MLAEVTFEHRDGTLVAALAGDVDMSNAADVEAALAGAIGNQELALVIDMAAVDYFDSAGIHVVYDLRERLRVRGIGLRLVIPPGSNARAALELAGVLHAVGADETLEQALAAVRPRGG
jgi:anti-anti-sigma factor